MKMKIKETRMLNENVLDFDPTHNIA